MIKKCVGCGAILQDNNPLIEGYTTVLTNDLCKRCFRMKNYGEYEFVTKDNLEYVKILNNIKNKSCLVLYIVDLLAIPKDITKIKEYVGENEIILILNKKDVLPKSVKEEKIINYFANMEIPFEKVIVISVEKNKNIDYLLKQIKLYQTSKDVYVVGHTNAGKSTLINKLISNYSDNNEELTISPLPATTLSTVKIELNDYLTLIDTPGLVDNGSIVNVVDKTVLKKISPRKEIKPKTYQIKKGQSILVDDLLRIDYVEGEKNSFTFYMSNDLKIRKIASRRMDLKEMGKTTHQMKFDEDLCINGLGFIKMVNQGTVDIYTYPNVTSYTRKNLI